MAINEACQVWIEQRIQEELESGADNLSALGRELSDEVGRIFETRISADTLRKRAARMARTNVQGSENLATTWVEGGDSGDILRTEVVVKKVGALVAGGQSVREAATAVAEETGNKPESVRKAYARERERGTNVPREKEPQAYHNTATEAWQFAEVAVMQLQRIRKDDPKREEAFDRVINWISGERSKLNG